MKMMLSGSGPSGVRVRVTFSVDSGVLSRLPSIVTHACLKSLLSTRKLLIILKSSAAEREREKASFNVLYPCTHIQY